MHIYMIYIYPGIPTSIKTMGVDLNTIAYNPKGLNHRNWGTTIILMVVGFPRVYISIPLLLRDMCFFDLQATPRRSERRRWFLGERSRPSPRSVMCAGESFLSCESCESCIRPCAFVEIFDMMIYLFLYIYICN